MQVQDTDDLLTRLGDSRDIESRIIDFIVSSRDTVTYSYSALKAKSIKDKIEKERQQVEELKLDTLKRSVS